MSNDLIKCICCDKEQEVLISVEMKNNSIFMNRRGVCQDCIKTKNINEVCKNFEIRKTKEAIYDIKMNLITLENNLKELEK